MSEKFKTLETALANKNAALELELNYREAKNSEISNIVKLEKLEKLTLSNYPDDYFFPKKIYEISQLNSLTLINCRFSRIPDGLINAKKLKELKLINCKFGKISEELLNSSTIEILHLENTDLQNLLNADFANSKITALVFVGKDLSLFNQIIGKFKKLKSIVLKENNISTIPDALFEQSKLESLCIIDNKFEILPENLSEFKKLKSIDFSFNSLNQIETDFKLMPKLEKLKLNNNKFTAFHERILDINNLNFISLCNNRFYDLPEALFQMKQLKRVEMFSTSRIYLPLNVINWLENKSNTLISTNHIQNLINSNFFNLAEPSLKIELAMIHLLNPMSVDKNLKLSHIQELISIKYSFTQDFAYVHAVNNHKLAEGDVIYFWDSWSKLKNDLKASLSERGVKIATKLTEKVSIVIVSPRILDSEDLIPVFSGNYKLMTDYGLLVSLTEEIPYLINSDSDMTENLRKLLRSKDLININLALEMIKIGGIPDGILMNMISTVFYSYHKKETIEKILKYLKRYAEPGWDIVLYKILKTTEKTMHYNERIIYITNNANPAFMKINIFDLCNYNLYSF